MLQRYCGYLNHVSRQGDVMAESRGGKEDRLLKASYQWVYERGAWICNAEFFQKALTSRELKVKPKSANIAGLQLADLLAHPIRQAVLREHGCISEAPSRFVQEVLDAVADKFNRHLYDGRVAGYGIVFCPKK
jgi:predicted TPR repeat methyltransferase